ncbi:MAG: hypothetical protein R2860_12380 [Desulfobacterales bacterium]
MLYLHAPTIQIDSIRGPESSRMRPPPTMSAAGYDYDDIIREASRSHGIQFGLIKALIHAESTLQLPRHFLRRRYGADADYAGQLK